MDKVHVPKRSTDPEFKMSAPSDAHRVGTAVGATGAVAGQGLAEAVNPTVEDAYWRDNFSKRDYIKPDRPYADYQSAYRYGWESRGRMGDRPFRDVERDLAVGWEKAKGASKLTWVEAKHAVSDAWQRIKGH
jgi:hypothetical protein